MANPLAGPTTSIRRSSWSSAMSAIRSRCAPHCAASTPVYHFAAAVGVGQSMYEVVQYTRINNLGTAVLLEALIQKPVRRLIVASSMSLYGEGLYRTTSGEVRTVGERPLEQLRRGDWEWRDEAG
jgi:dTDP-L-rhamnose 4-epimerase